MKYLIINADDFGASPGINRGIIDAHRYGVVTSASLLVNTPFSAEAARLAGGVKHLGVGLHFDFSTARSSDLHSVWWLDELLWQQVRRFEVLMGRRPTHLDSHHNVHRDLKLLSHFLAVAGQLGLPLREHSSVRHFPSFYGQWNGESHPEQISVEAFIQMVDTEICGGVTEVGCHPGYIDGKFETEYAGERELEFHTLSNPTLRRALSERSVQLINFSELHDFMPTAAAA
jgi:predicted glycoside hydrolase/deacetylase ChbG (UPF0249 family)